MVPKREFESVFPPEAKNTRAEKGRVFFSSAPTGKGLVFYSSGPRGRCPYGCIFREKHKETKGFGRIWVEICHSWRGGQPAGNLEKAGVFFSSGRILDILGSTKTMIE